MASKLIPFSEMKVKIRPGTAYEDACALRGQNPATIETFSGVHESRRQYLYSVERIATVCEAFQQDRPFNYDNSSEEKRFPWWDLRSTAGAGSGFSLHGIAFDRTGSRVGSRLSSFSKEEANYIAEIMADDYRVIMKDQGIQNHWLAVLNGKIAELDNKGFLTDELKHQLMDALKSVASKS